jgi:hypothetical protein
VTEGIELAGCELMSADWDRAATHFLMLGEGAVDALRRAHQVLFASAPAPGSATRATDGGVVLAANGGEVTRN